MVLRRKNFPCPMAIHPNLLESLPSPYILPHDFRKYLPLGTQALSNSFTRKRAEIIINKKHLRPLHNHLVVVDISVNRRLNKILLIIY